jgi:hypothetical protein
MKATMKMTDSFRELWSEILIEGGPRQRLVEGHPLRLYFGCNAASRPIFFLITKHRPDIPLFSSVVSVERGQRADGNWTVVLTLKDRSLEGPFIGMCAELARLSSASESPEDALASFYSTLRQWRVMLTGKPKNILSKEEIRGLVGEIWFGLKCLSTDFSPSEVLTSWQGPFGAPQDYRLPNGNLCEIKAVHANSGSIEISSPEQLDPADGAPLRLVLVTVEEAEVIGAGSLYSLKSIVDEFRQYVQLDQAAADGFEVRLDSLGYDPSDEHYEDTLFSVTGAKIFEVDECFPRVDRANIPVDVEKLNYKLKTAGFIDRALVEPISFN